MPGRGDGKRWFDRCLARHEQRHRRRRGAAHPLRAGATAWRLAHRAGLAAARSAAQTRIWRNGAHASRTARSRSRTAVHVYDPTIGLHSAGVGPVDDGASTPTSCPATTAPDDARSLCFTRRYRLREPLEPGSATRAPLLDVTPSDLSPLNLVVKLPEWRGQRPLDAHHRRMGRLNEAGAARRAAAGVEVPLRADRFIASALRRGGRASLTAFRADFPRAMADAQAGDAGAVMADASACRNARRGRRHRSRAGARPGAKALASAQRPRRRPALRRAQRPDELAIPIASLEAARIEHVRIDPPTTYHADHSLRCRGDRPPGLDLARMSSDDEDRDRAPDQPHRFRRAHGRRSAHATSVAPSTSASTASPSELCLHGASGPRGMRYL